MELNFAQHLILCLIVCNYPCPDGHQANAACDGCVINDTCVANTPCQHNGTCTLTTPPDQYNCTCTGPFTGTDCEGH